jgi:hypothetical protein
MSEKNNVLNNFYQQLTLKNFWEGELKLVFL